MRLTKYAFRQEIKMDLFTTIIQSLATCDNCSEKQFMEQLIAWKYVATISK